MQHASISRSRYVQGNRKMRFKEAVSLRQTCMKSFDVLANLVVEFNPVRSTADGQRSKCRANGWSWREPGAGRAAFQALA